MPFTSEQRATFDDAYRKGVSVTEESKLVGITDFMIKVLLESGEAVEREMLCTTIVPHNSNRGGADMQASKMFEKTAKILGVGFSFKKCDPSRAICFQKKPGMASKFVKMANASPHFATFEEHKVEGESVGCGHLNQGLAAIVQEILVPPDFENHMDLFGPTGGKRLNRHDICQRDHHATKGKSLAQALDRGLTWTYIYSHIADEYPGLPNLFQKALNVEHHIGEGETWDEQFGAIARSIVDHYRKSGPKAKAPDSKSLSRTALASKPPRADDVPAQVDWCKTWGGGNSQEYAIDICTYVKKKSKSHAVVGSQFDSMSKMKVPISVNLAHFVAAIVKAAATRGKSKIGASMHVTDGDITSIVTKRLALASEADSFMVRAKQICAQLKGDFDELRGDMECDMVDFVLEKLPKEQREGVNLSLIVEGFIHKVTAPSVAEDKSTSAEPASSTAGNYVFDPTHDVAQQTLANLGWKVGNLVSPKKLKEPSCAGVQYEVGYVNDDGSIGLHPILADGTTDKKEITVIKSESIREYRQVDKSSRLSIDDNYPHKFEIGESFWASAAIIGINAAYCTAAKVPKDVLYMQKFPNSKMIAKEPIVIGDVVFVAWTHNVKLVKMDDESSVNVAIIDGKYKFQMTKPEPNHHPLVEFWRVNRVDSEKNANMKIEMITRTIPLPKITRYDVTSPMSVSVASAVLTKDIAKGDELLLYAPFKKKEVVKRGLAMEFKPIPTVMGKEKAQKKARGA